MKTKSIWLLLLLLPMGLTVNAQEENYKPPLFGVGINLTQFRISDLFNDYYGAPANSLMITVSPLKYLRFEPQIGYYSEKYEDDLGNGQKFDMRDRLLSFGIGAFGMLQKVKTNIYFGLRYENARIKDEFLDLEYDPVTFQSYYSKKISESTRSTVAPTVGAEYFLGEHFSVGGEFAFRIMNFKTTTEGSAITEKSSASNTDAGLQIRFYF